MVIFTPITISHIIDYTTKNKRNMSKPVRWENYTEISTNIQYPSLTYQHPSLTLLNDKNYIKKGQDCNVAW